MQYIEQDLQTSDQIRYYARVQAFILTPLSETSPGTLRNSYPSFSADTKFIMLPFQRNKVDISVCLVHIYIAHITEIRWCVRK
jgi:hypothetical protein